MCSFVTFTGLCRIEAPVRNFKTLLSSEDMDPINFGIKSVQKSYSLFSYRFHGDLIGLRNHHRTRGLCVHTEPSARGLG